LKNGIEVERCYSEQVIETLEKLSLPVEKITPKGVFYPQKGSMVIYAPLRHIHDELEKQMEAAADIYLALTEEGAPRRAKIDQKQQRLRKKRLLHKHRLERKKQRQAKKRQPPPKPQRDIVNITFPSASNSVQESSLASVALISHQQCLLRFEKGAWLKQGKGCTSYQKMEQFYKKSVPLPAKALKRFTNQETIQYLNVFQQHFKEIPGRRVFMIADGVHYAAFLKIPLFSHITFNNKSYYLLRNSRHPPLSLKDPKSDLPGQWDIFIMLVEQSEQTDRIRQRYEQVLKKVPSAKFSSGGDGK
jgi:hypothetical protein